MSTRRKLTIWLAETRADLAAGLLAQGHIVLEKPEDAWQADLLIGPSCWHLPDNAPNPGEHVARAVAWMQRVKYGGGESKGKPSKR